jgi:hypothetical protein
MKEPKKLKRAVIKEELVELTNDTITAIILNQFINWAEIFKQWYEEEWITKSASEINEECMLKMSEVTVRAHIKKLVEECFLEERKHPKWNHTLQYRVNLENINNAIREL